MAQSYDEQTESTDPGEGADLGQLVSKGLRWSLVNNLTSRVGTVLTGVVLARLLLPSEYGVYTVAFVALIVLSNINDLGVEVAVIRYPGNVDEIGPSAVTCIFGSSIVLFVASFLAAPLFADALSQPEAAGVIRLLTVCVLINGAFAVQSGLLTREFQQARRAAADLTGLAISLVVTIVMAAKGYGPWSLAWGRVVGNLVNGLLHFFLARARYRPGYRPETVRSLLRVGVPVAGASLFTEAVNDVDYGVVSRVLGATQLGLYLMAFNLSSWPVSTLSMAVNRVSVPGFARMQHDRASLEDAFARSLALIVGVSAFICAVLGVLSLQVVRFVYGPTWEPAAVALRYLVVLGALRVALGLGRDLLVAIGLGRSSLAIQSAWLVVLLPALVIGATHDGIRGVGIAHMVVALAVPVPATLWVLRRAGFSTRSMLVHLPRTIVGAGVAGAAAYLVTTILSGDALQLVVGGLVAGAVELAIAGPLLLRLARSLRAIAVVPASLRETDVAAFDAEQAPF